MKNLLSNKFNLIPQCSLAIGLIGVFVSALGLGIPGIVMAGAGLLGSIASRILCKKLGLNEILCFVAVLASILLLIGAGAAYGARIVLEITSAKDIG